MRADVDSAFRVSSNAMATGAMIHTFAVQLADVDRGVYDELSLRVARPVRFTLPDLVAAGTLSGQGAEVLQELVASRLAFLVTGGTRPVVEQVMPYRSRSATSWCARAPEWWCQRDEAGSARASTRASRTSSTRTTETAVASKSRSGGLEQHPCGIGQRRLIWHGLRLSSALSRCWRTARPTTAPSTVPRVGGPANTRGWSSDVFQSG